MANIKISELPAAASAGGAQEFEVNDSGTSRKVTGAQVKTYVKDGLVASDITDLTATATELNYTDGVTSNIQTQLNAKAATSTTISAGAGLTGGGDLSANRTISHADTSTQASVNNSGNTFIQDITLDTYGHVTGIVSATAGGSVDYQVFTASGTWTKPAGVTTVYVQIWGGGGSGTARGGSTRDAGGGGGGGYTSGFFTASSLGATVSVTVGAGGAARSSSGAPVSGLSGGSSSFGSISVGGGGGAVGSDGGAGGNGELATRGQYDSGSSSFFLSQAGVGGVSGSGGVGIRGSGNYRNGIKCSFGGGGGGGANDAAGSGGVSSLGGNGGAGSLTVAAAGTVPGGGGGGAARSSGTATSGAGARGEVRVWAW